MYYKLILNIIVAMFIYNIFLSALSKAILEAVFGNKKRMDKVNETFAEKIEELKKTKE